MAETKYADLPGIAYDQPDIYETDDLPEADQNIEQAEEDSDSIDRPQLSVDSAFGKFKGKVLLKDRVDFSDRISKNLRTGYDARPCEWELVGQGENETPLQKYQRLKCEITELTEEVQKLKGSVKEDSSSAVPAVEQVQRLLQQLGEVRLEEQLGSELVTSLADPQGATLRKLLSQLEGLKKIGNEAAPEDKKAAAAASKTSGEAGTVCYELMYKPDHARLLQTTRIAQLENRLHSLESAVGDVPEKLSRLSADTRSLPLTGAVQLLSSKTSLLDSAQLDHIEGRLTALAAKMNQISEQSAPREVIEQDKKISELYDLAVKCESMSSLLPQVSERMAAIQNLQEQALTFSKSLAQLDGLQDQITSSLANNETLLKDVQKSFTQNMDTMQKNMTSLDTRIAALKKK